MHRIFHEMDEDNSGEIEAFELKKVMQKLGNPLISDPQVLEIIREFDIDGNGTISEDEFITYMENKLRRPS